MHLTAHIILWESDDLSQLIIYLVTQHCCNLLFVLSLLLIVALVQVAKWGQMDRTTIKTQHLIHKSLLYQMMSIVHYYLRCWCQRQRYRSSLKVVLFATTKEQGLILLLLWYLNTFESISIHTWMTYDMKTM
jgi:hypothetical protein